MLFAKVKNIQSAVLVVKVMNFGVWISAHETRLSINLAGPNLLTYV